MHLLALAFTVVVVVALGVVAIVCSTSNGVDWLQSQWQRRSEESRGGGETERPDDKGPSGH